LYELCVRVYTEKDILSLNLKNLKELNKLVVVVHTCDNNIFNILNDKINNSTIKHVEYSICDYDFTHSIIKIDKFIDSFVLNVFSINDRKRLVIEECIDCKVKSINEFMNEYPSLHDYLNKLISNKKIEDCYFYFDLSLNTKYINIKGKSHSNDIEEILYNKVSFYNNTSLDANYQKIKYRFLNYDLDLCCLNCNKQIIKKRKKNKSSALSCSSPSLS
jgi:hypothetical protein